MGPLGRLFCSKPPDLARFGSLARLVMRNAEACWNPVERKGGLYCHSVPGLTLSASHARDAAFSIPSTVFDAIRRDPGEDVQKPNLLTPGLLAHYSESSLEFSDRKAARRPSLRGSTTNPLLVKSRAESVLLFRSTQRTRRIDYIVYGRALIALIALIALMNGRVRRSDSGQGEVSAQVSQRA